MNKKCLTSGVIYDIILSPLKGSFFLHKNRFNDNKLRKCAFCPCIQAADGTVAVCRTEGGVYFYGVGFNPTLLSKSKKYFRKAGGAVMRVKITLACTECKQRNYNTMKNKKNDPDRLEMNKYCRFCRKHTLHKETK